MPNGKFERFSSPSPEDQKYLAMRREKQEMVNVRQDAWPQIVEVIGRVITLK